MSSAAGSRLITAFFKAPDDGAVASRLGDSHAAAGPDATVEGEVESNDGGGADSDESSCIVQNECASLVDGKMTAKRSFSDSKCSETSLVSEFDCNDTTHAVSAAAPLSNVSDCVVTGTSLEDSKNVRSSTNVFQPKTNGRLVGCGVAAARQPGLVSAEEEALEEEEDGILNTAMVASQSDSTSACVVSQSESTCADLLSSGHHDSASELSSVQMSGRYDSSSEDVSMATASQSDSTSSDGRCEESDREGSSLIQTQHSLVVNLNSLLSPCVGGKVGDQKDVHKEREKCHAKRKTRRRKRASVDLRTMLGRQALSDCVLESNTSSLERDASDGNMAESTSSDCEVELISVASVSHESVESLSQPSCEEDEHQESVILISPSASPPHSPTTPLLPPPPPPPNQPSHSPSELTVVAANKDCSHSLSPAWASLFRKPKASSTIVGPDSTITASRTKDSVADMSTGGEDSATAKTTPAVRGSFTSGDEATTSSQGDSSCVNGKGTSNRSARVDDLTASPKSKKRRQRCRTPNLSPRKCRSPVHSPARSPRRHRLTSLSPRKGLSPRKHSTLAASSLRGVAQSVSMATTVGDKLHPLSKMGVADAKYDHTPFSGLTHVRQWDVGGGKVCNRSKLLPQVANLLRREREVESVSQGFSVPPSSGGLGLVRACEEGGGEVEGEGTLPRPKVSQLRQLEAEE